MSDNKVDIKVNIDLSKLETLKSSVADNYYAKVGILAGKAQQQHKNTTIKNVDLGLVHEFGSVSKNIPARSFLRMPLELKQEIIVAYLKAHGHEVSEAMTKKELKKIIAQLGIKAEEIIQEAFETNGFGEWAPHKESTETARKKKLKTKKAKEQYIASILVNTGQLRRAITSKVDKD